MSLSIVGALRECVPDLGARHACELSARGPLHAFLRKRVASLAASEYFHGLPSGSVRGGIRCEDVQNLSYRDASFDLCTSTDVFEHVVDDAAGFSEVRRVLRPGGLLVFTVPLHGGAETLERAVLLADGSLRHLAPPEYHGDPVGEGARILAFRSYGEDVLERLRAAGFRRVELLEPPAGLPWGYGRRVVLAQVD